MDYSKKTALKKEQLLFEKKLKSCAEIQELYNIYENMKDLMKTLYAESNYYQIDNIKLYLNNLSNHTEPIQKHTYIKNMINVHAVLWSSNYAKINEFMNTYAELIITLCVLYDKLNELYKNDSFTENKEKAKEISYNTAKSIKLPEILGTFNNFDITTLESELSEMEKEIYIIKKIKGVKQS